ncbi:hypothetical protein SPSYN_00624 [Sporotomaculum syntrophicum]|uniref:Uncharacterized protein n=1 Tax=Sporotomaculum syntrophicum TaxID=182264 RepID=A0A9D2WR83_9FIRM|nr:hypothetical protein SPSYN_00624 [Sporotomaculum syntrophicum]
MSERLDLQCKLPHLDRAQVKEYIYQHPAYAGAKHDIFSDNAIDKIYRFSSSAARLVNKACMHCMLDGAQNGRRIIDEHMLGIIRQQ